MCTKSTSLLANRKLFFFSKRRLNNSMQLNTHDCYCKFETFIQVNLKRTTCYWWTLKHSYIFKLHCSISILLKNLHSVSLFIVLLNKQWHPLFQFISSSHGKWLLLIIREGKVTHTYRWPASSLPDVIELPVEGAAGIAITFICCAAQITPVVLTFSFDCHCLVYLKKSY